MSDKFYVIRSTVTGDLHGGHARRHVNDPLPLLYHLREAKAACGRLNEYQTGWDGENLVKTTRGKDCPFEIVEATLTLGDGFVYDAPEKKY